MSELALLGCGDGVDTQHRHYMGGSLLPREATVGTERSPWGGEDPAEGVRSACSPALLTERESHDTGPLGMLD